MFRGSIMAIKMVIKLDININTMAMSSKNRMTYAPPSSALGESESIINDSGATNNKAKEK